MATWFRRADGDPDGGVAAGQRYRAIGTGKILWEVTKIYRAPWEPFAHVRLHRVGVPCDVKTIALETLRDERYFEPAI